MKERISVTELMKLYKRGIANGNKSIKMFVNGEEYGEYDLTTEQTIDSKTPQAWLKGNLVFMKFRFKEINSVSLKLV